MIYGGFYSVSIASALVFENAETIAYGGVVAEYHPSSYIRQITHNLQLQFIGVMKSIQIGGITCWISVAEYFVFVVQVYLNVAIVGPLTNILIGSVSFEFIANSLYELVLSQIIVR